MDDMEHAECSGSSEDMITKLEYPVVTDIEWNDRIDVVEVVTVTTDQWNCDFSECPDAEDIMRRHSDLKRKRKQRTNPLYRAKENAKTRERMREKRNQTEFRQLERERDRVRKQIMRRNLNIEKREFLRQQDRERKRERRRLLKETHKSPSTT